ncbi:protein FAM107B isoform X1 [Salmo salar]|uniref:Actin-associated protein FAM107A n=1 Tax=Salmo salar TaxID=8030 RepID=A0A1S3P3V3_SALSA|nr:protein FAM107B-like isoform X1 [Salmo salar]|eukprot:XP_014022231.1 PREDICTED: protein FAM107B-like isoform X1 [Salmo salar]
MGASYSKKKAYNINQQQQRVKNGKHRNGTASAYANLQWEQQPRQDGSHPPQDYPQRDQPPVAGYIPQPNYMEEDHDLIKPKKLLNPVKASKSHQDLQRELLMSQKRTGVVGVESKPELQRVLEARKREKMIKQRKEDEARKKISPLEQELLKRKDKLEELEKEQEKQEETVKAPEFVKVKENLRRTSFHSNGEKEV